MKPRVLLLSYAFPPVAMPEALLSAKRLGNLSGFDVDVICVQPAGTAIRIDLSLEFYVSERFARVERLEIPVALNRLIGRRISSIFQVPGLIRIMNRKAFRKAVQLGPERYAAMVTWSQWHSIHLVGLALKTKYPRLPWIAHFSDPWSYNPFARFGRLMQLYSRHLESKVYKAADRLSFTSRETIDLVLSGESQSIRAKAFELPHAFERELYPVAEPLQSGPLILRSLGNFYGPRSPEPLFRALAILHRRNPTLLARMRVELIGSMPEEFCNSSTLRALPHGVVHVLPPVEYRTSLKLMRSADLLLNIDAPFKNSVFLPSKLVDYIGAERPVLGISPPGTASRVIRSFGGWVVEPENPEAVAAILETALAHIERHRGAPWGDDEVRDEYAASTVSERFAHLIREIALDSKHARNPIGSIAPDG